MNGSSTGWAVAYANICCASCVPERRGAGNTRHQGGHNMTFVDGHVEYQRHLELAHILDTVSLRNRHFYNAD